MKNSKKLFLVLASGALILTACGGKKKDPKPSPSGQTPTGQETSPVDPASSPVAPTTEPSSPVAPTSEPVEPTSSPAASTSPAELPLAEGLFNYKKSSNAERTEILGALEKWAVDNKLTGITIYEDGGYVMYNPVVQKGAPNYVKGFGFGILSEGQLTGPLTGEEQSKYQMYYHSYESEDPNKILYMDDDGSVVSDLVGYVSSGTYEIVLDETRTGYEWVGELARNDEPIAINPDEDGASRTYRVPVKTGKDLKYDTLTSVNKLKGFKDREVELDDYLTPYQVYYTKAFGIKRTAEVKDDVSGSLVGGEGYVAASAEGYNEQEFAKVGVKVGTDTEIGDYLEFKFNAAVTPFWARYYLANSMFAPVPKDFLAALGNGTDWTTGVSLWGKWDNNATMSPRDTFLSTGPYTIEEWTKDTLISFKRNPNYIYGEDRETSRPSHYYIEGVYVDIITALSTDPEAAFKKFLANKLHSCGIPSTQLENYARDPRTTIVPGATTTKLNLNTCTQESWNALFGENGSISQTPAEKAWACEPAMSNKSFVDGLSFALDRLSLAISIGATPSNNYFGSGYYSDPEEGIFYNDTEAHARAVADSLEGTDGYGFSVEKAKVAFKKAADELKAAGTYKDGDTISLEMAWQRQTNIERFGEPLAKNIKDAFDAANTGLKLNITHFVGDSWTDVYYKKMMVGQFDIGYGGVEGNAYDPLNFLEVLKSDNSSQFTLNWGIPTDEYAEIEWDGMLWTFDALWSAADHGAFVKDGKMDREIVTYDFVINDVIRNADGSLTVKAKEFNLCMLNTDGSIKYLAETFALVLYATNLSSGADYTEVAFFPDGTSDTEGFACNWVQGNEEDELGYHDVEITINAEGIAEWVDTFAEPYAQGFDVYNLVTTFGQTGDPAFANTVWQGLIPAIPAEE